nr:reverse transcriptase domain-containing protein [Tanacetum cinerariifolium]
MADNRTMAQILQAPIEGYEDAIIVPQINANNFELKQTLINLVQSNQFTGRQDPHNHLRFFNKVTSTFRHPEVPNTTIKLLLFPFSLEGEARIWLDKEPPRSILTWEDLVSKFINQFFPPSKTTYLQNKIINFLQKPNKTFNEAWERFKDLLCQFPHHGFSELHQLDTFYNTLNPMIRMHLIQQPEEISWIRFPENVYRSLKIAASLEDKLDIRMNRFKKSLNDMKNSFITPTSPLKAVAETAAVGNFIQNRQNVSNQMRPSGFNQPTHQNNNQNCFQVDYLSKWVEAKTLPTNDAQVVVKFLNSLFSRFGTPKAIISDRGTHFCNDQFARVMSKYGVTHRLSTAYHPQTSGQVEVTNRGLKQILERTVGENPALWSDKLEDALSAFRTAFKTPVLYCIPPPNKRAGLSPMIEVFLFWIFVQFLRSSHPSIKISLGKSISFDTYCLALNFYLYAQILNIGDNVYLLVWGDHQKLQLNELSELRDQAYENSLIYKEWTNKLHDAKIKNRIFNVGDQVFLFNFRLKIFSGKLKSRWSGPFTIFEIYPYRTAKLTHSDGSSFKVNCHRLKHYHGGDPPLLEIPDI